MTSPVSDAMNAIIQAARPHDHEPLVFSYAQVERGLKAKEEAADQSPAEEVADAVDEALRAFHYETFRAGVCYERDEWPHTDEEWDDLDRGIQSEAVGEHYEGWAEETIAKLSAALSAIRNSDEGMREALIEARLYVEQAGFRHHDVSELLIKIDTALNTTKGGGDA